MSELRHYGIMGMKWGIRRYQNSDGTLTDAGKQRYSTANDVHEDSARARSKSAKAMSDQELNTSINRIRREQEYASLTKTGMQKAEETVKKYGGKIVGTIVLGTAGALATRYIYKRINPAKGETPATISGDIQKFRDRQKAKQTWRSVSENIGAAREARKAAAAEAARQAASSNSVNPETVSRGAQWLIRMMTGSKPSDLLDAKQ